MSAENEVALYDAGLLLQLDFHKSPTKFDPPITAAAPGEPWLKVRPLQNGDYERGFPQILSQLTELGEVSNEQFQARFAEMKALGDYYVTVIEDTRTSKIIGAATLLVERKFIRSCALRGRLEDVVVNSTYRGKQLGKLIVTTVTLLAEHLGCYKMTLDCKDKMIPFYNSLGYNLEPGNSNMMSVRYPGTGGAKNGENNTSNGVGTTQKSS